MCLFEFKALCCDDLPHEVFINHSVPPASRRKYSQTFLLCLFDIPTFLLCIAQAELAVFGFGDAPHRGVTGALALPGTRRGPFASAALTARSLRPSLVLVKYVRISDFLFLFFFNFRI